MIYKTNLKQLLSCGALSLLLHGPGLLHAQVLTAYWNFNDASSPEQSTATVGGFTGMFENGVIYTPDAGGQSGEPGDLAVDFGTDAAQRVIRVSDIADALNMVAAGDVVTVTWWQRWSTAPVNSSSFWWVSDLASGVQRGMQGHVPYGNGQVYFDSAGCCTGGAQRLNGTPPGITWENEWRHLTYVKNGPDKEIWIDGVRVLNNTGANPLPTDMLELHLGRDHSNNGNQFRGLIDDFAIFASALTPEQISLLAGGASPQALVLDTDSDGMPDAFEDLYELDKNSAADAALDPDEDGLANLEEFTRGTHPRNADTDEDGLMDSIETNTGVWASETDTGTSPLNPDTDGDDLLDGVETNTGVFTDENDTGTNPHLADTDSDGISDGSEVVLGSSPVDPNSTPDLGGDGIRLFAYWDFNDAADPDSTTDLVHDIVGLLQGGAAFTEDAGGHTGEPGDRAVDFGGTAANQLVRANSGEAIGWFNTAAAEDTITVSYWQKWNTPVMNSVAVRWVSPSSSGGQRGFHAESPWGNNMVVFDTAGCCTIGNQRLQQDITAVFPAISPHAFFSTWRNIVLVKNETVKQIWIDGALFTEASGADPLPTDMIDFIIGAEQSGANSIRARIDDFAAFASALSPEQIYALARGISPLNLANAAADADADGLPDWWEDQQGLNKNSAADASQDGDNDGLTNLLEYERRTDSANPDTDGDGANDGVETNNGFWISEADRGTDPRLDDVDYDGLPDGVENNTVVFTDATRTGTDPFLADSDADLYSDAAEVLIGSSPVDFSDVPHTPGEPNLLAYWDFNDAGDPARALDRVHGFEGLVLGGAAYTSGGDGRSGSGSDRAMDFGPDAGGQVVHVPDAHWLNVAGVPDEMTVTFWVKYSDIANSTVFWFVAPSTILRGASAHAPYGNGTIYWDTAGCCNGANERINLGFNAAASPFAAEDIEAFFSEWRHFAFVRRNDTTKEIWIDGQLFLAGASLDFLPIDYTEAFIGAELGAGNSVRGMIDDFAVYASGLSQQQIEALAAGASPIDFEIPVPEFELEITGITHEGSSVVIQWQAESGQAYDILRSTDLSTWNSAGTVTASGATATFTDSSLPAGANAVFYQLQEQ